MNQASDVVAIESLKTFALAHNEIEFVHLCDAAVAGVEWAMIRLAPVLYAWRATTMAGKRAQVRLKIIRDTDTTRPDGAIARGFEV